MANKNTLEILIRANDKASRTIAGLAKSVGDDMKSVGTSMMKSGASMGLFAAPAVAGFAAATSAAADFESQMDNIQSILGSTDAETAALTNTLLEFGAASLAGPDAVALAFEEIAGGVEDTSTHMAILEQSIKTAEAGQADLLGTTSAMVSVMNSYALSAADAAMVSDVLTRTVGMGVGSMEQFAGAFPAVTGLAASLGVSFEDVGTAAAFMTTKGFTAAQATNQLKAMMVSMLNPNAKMQQGLADIGFASGTAAIEQLGLVGAFQMLNNESPSFQANMAGAVGSVEALNGVIGLTDDSFNDFAKTFSEGVEGATDAAQKIQLDNFTAQMGILKSSAEALTIQIGMALLPTLTRLVRILQPITNALTQWATANQGAIEIAATFVGVLAGLASAWFTLGGVIFLGGVILANLPLLAVVAGLTALITVVNTVAKTFEKLLANGDKTALMFKALLNVLSVGDFKTAGHLFNALVLQPIKTGLEDLALSAIPSIFSDLGKAFDLLVPGGNKTVLLFKALLDVMSVSDFKTARFIFSALIQDIKTGMTNLARSIIPPALLDIGIAIGTVFSGLGVAFSNLGIAFNDLIPEGNKTVLMFKALIDVLSVGDFKTAGHLFNALIQEINTNFKNLDSEKFAPIITAIKGIFEALPLPKIDLSSLKTDIETRFNTMFGTLNFDTTVLSGAISGAFASLLAIDPTSGLVSLDLQPIADSIAENLVEVLQIAIPLALGMGFGGLVVAGLIKAFETDFLGFRTALEESGVLTSIEDGLTVITDAISGLFDLGGEDTQDGGALEGIISSLDIALQPLAELITGTWASIAPGLTAMKDGIIGFIAAFEGTETENIVSSLQDIGGALSSFFAPFVLFSADVIGTTLEAIGNFLPALGTGISSLITATDQLLAGDTGGALETLGDGISAITEGFEGFNQDLLSGLVSSLSDLVGLDLTTLDIGTWVIDEVWTPLTTGLSDSTETQNVAFAAGELAGSILTGLVSGIGSIASWVNTNVILPIVNMLTGGGGDERGGGGVQGASEGMGFTILKGIANAFLSMDAWVLKNIITPFVVGLSGAGKDATLEEASIAIGQAVLDGIGSLFDDLDDWVLTEIIQPIINDMIDSIPLLNDQGKELGKSIVEGIINGITSTSGVAAAIASLIPEVDLGPLGTFGGGGGSQQSDTSEAEGRTAGRALGGPVSANIPFIVGERGPELFVPQSSGRVVPNHQLGSNAGGGGGSVMNLDGANIVLPGVTNARQFFDELEAEARRRNRRLAPARGGLG